MTEIMCDELRAGVDGTRYYDAARRFDEIRSLLDCIGLPDATAPTSPFALLGRRTNRRTKDRDTVITDRSLVLLLLEGQYTFELELLDKARKEGIARSAPDLSDLRALVAALREHVNDVAEPLR